MGEPITWSNETRRLSQLIPWKRNPRHIKTDAARRLQESLEEFGQVEPVCIGPANELYNGHQRLNSWAAKFGDLEIAVRVASRALTEKEREKLTVFLHKGAVGGWDFDTLANEFEVPELLEWGFGEWELQVNGAVPVAHTRPDFDQLIEAFEQPEGQRGKSPKDGNWFYVEFYGDDATYAQLKEQLAAGLISPHQLDRDFFLGLVGGRVP